MPTLGQSHVVAENTDVATLRSGPGHYTDSGVPGSHKTVALAGHRTTYGAPFADVDELESGDPIVVTMPYGRLTYRVERTRIVDPSACWVTQRSRDRLVLTSCHPPFSAAQRIVVFARLAAQRDARRGGTSSPVHCDRRRLVARHPAEQLRCLGSHTKHGAVLRAYGRAIGRVPWPCRAASARFPGRPKQSSQAVGWRRSLCPQRGCPPAV